MPLCAGLGIGVVDVIGHPERSAELGRYGSTDHSPPLRTTLFKCNPDYEFDDLRIRHARIRTRLGGFGNRFGLFRMSPLFVDEQDHTEQDEDQ